MTPPVVKGLDQAGVALYHKLKAAMQDRQGPAAWEDSDHHLLAQTCRYDMRARNARDWFRDKDAGEMTTVGDRRQLTVHPLVKIAETAERAFVDCLKELGFTPRSRAQLSIERKSEAENKFGLG